MTWLELQQCQLGVVFQGEPLESQQIDWQKERCAHPHGYAITVPQPMSTTRYLNCNLIFVWEVAPPGCRQLQKGGTGHKYLRGMADLPLWLERDGSGTIKWYVDVSYAVHSDMKGHTGGTMSLGKGQYIAP